ncbi:hypothetical protein MMPV_004919 [Pyropia vietnamensis]
MASTTPLPRTSDSLDHDARRSGSAEMADTPGRRGSGGGDDAGGGGDGLSRLWSNRGAGALAGENGGAAGGGDGTPGGGGGGRRPSKGTVWGGESKAPDVPASVRAGLAAASAFETLESPAEVAAWLRAIHLPQYVSTFVAHGVSFGTLLTLNSVELRDALGVKPLAHRRLLLDGIAYLAETLHVDTVAALPEDGRILTHLSNERTYLGWCRTVILLLAVATSTLQLVVVPEPVGNSPAARAAAAAVAAAAGGERGNKAWVTAVCTAFTVIAVGTLLYALWRFNWNWKVIEEAGRNFEADNVPRAAPVLVAGIGGLITAYALMAGKSVAALRLEDAVIDLADTARLASTLLLMAV